MLPETLTALACLIANPGSIDTSNLKAQLSEAEVEQAQAVIDSGACLPASIETLLQNTRLRIQNGELRDMDAGGSSPTMGGG